MSPAHAQTLILEPGQTLSDQAPPLDGLRVILEADTGVGKTHYILYTIAAQTPLVLLLPTVNQVQQLAATYTQPADYVYGQSHPETLGSVIIATYDQADWIAHQLGARCEDYALVIDEIHQLYQAGHYRARVLTKLYALIDHLGTPGQFRQLIGLSATPNPELFYFEADCWWRIERTTTPSRPFRLVEYQDLKLWLDWLTHERATILNPAQLHVIRLNNVADLDTLELYFTELGYRVLTVHSRVQDTEAVQEMLASQEVDASYNLLLTTSLIDEGINLMNTDVGSIHSIGPTTHLSEIRQCLGRFRRATPTVYLHLPTLASDPAPRLDLIAEGNALVETCEDIATLVRRLIPRLTTPSHIPRLVREWNQSLHWLLGFKPLLLRGNPNDAHITINEPALVAHLFQLDTQYQYSSHQVFKQSLNQNFPKHSLQTQSVNWKASRIDNDLQTAYTLQEEQRIALIDSARHYLEDAVQKLEYPDLLTALHAWGQELAFVNTPQAALVRLLNRLASEVVVNVNDAFAIVRQNTVQAVWQFHAGLDNWVVQALHAIIEEEFHLQPYNPAFQAPRLSRHQARQLVAKAVSRTAQQHPEYKRLVRENSRPGRRLWVKDNGHFDMTQQFVSQLFRNYTDSTITKKTITIQGLAWGGYHYRNLLPPTRQGVPTKKAVIF